MPLPIIIAAAAKLGLASVIGAAIQAVICSILVILVPFIFKYIMMWKGDMIFNAVFGFMGQIGIPTAVINMTGVAGWFAVRFRLMEVLTVILSAYLLRFIMDMVYKR